MSNNREPFNWDDAFQKYARNEGLEIRGGHLPLRIDANDQYQGCVYYSLRESSGDRFASFTFDLYRWDRSKLRELIDEAFSKCESRRLFVKGSRYSADFWMCRNPITNFDELKADFCALRKIVQTALQAWKNTQDARIKEGCKTDLSWSKIVLPAGLPLEEVVNRIKDDNIVLPAVQRGKAWNAARCATLWDSILRRFSIGSISVRFDQDQNRYDLLDGQQRTTSICLGYAPYPPENPLDDVLWLDLDSERSDECEFYFYVTTASHPWGYLRSTDETKNLRLRFSEIKEMLADDRLNWHNKNEKPFPCELWPKMAKLPVPFGLLRECLSADDSVEPVVENFIEWCYQSKGADGSKYCWNWLVNTQEHKAVKINMEIIRALKDLRNCELLIQDAGRVSENDVSLYFTRIGRGGVVPSNEELAYSVLKARLGKCGNDFRKGIEVASESLGLDRPSRMASMVVRYCLSGKENESKFYTGDVLGKIIEGSRGGKQMEWIDDLLKLVSIPTGQKESGFVNLCKTVNDDLKRTGYTSWHITRYCQRHNGIVYQFLMMLKHDYKQLILDSGLTLGGVAELLCWYTSDPAWVIRKILDSSSIAEGFAAAMQTTYYGTRRMRFPLACERVSGKISEEIKNECSLQGDVNFSEFVSLVSEGYGNEAAYSRLIFACNRSYFDVAKDKGNPLFEYNPLIGVWSEDVCPWDYDHILPRSWVDDLPNRADKDRNAWLVNSIGNLAPIDFSMNRSLSNKPRSQHYPVADLNDPDFALKQAGCCITTEDGRLIAEEAKSFNEKTLEWQRPFREMVLTRFERIYGLWYGSLFVKGSSISKLFALDPGRALGKRKKIILELMKQLTIYDAMIAYESVDGKVSGELPLRADESEWYVWEWIGVSVTTDSNKAEIWIGRDGKWELGRRDDNDSYVKNVNCGGSIGDPAEDVSAAIVEALKSTGGTTK